MQGTNYLFPLITLPYLIRMLGSDSFGIYAMILAGIQYVNIIVDFGFNFTATKLISIYKNNENEKNKIFTATIIIKFILFCLCLSVLLLLSLVLE
ncbi:oligosaccharide flippase family protein, partial [Escherichia coli]|uniref:oligosaccharide flippase family protein n=1 Tax=Escherichia coli TaxID=562 RepID=UPI0033920E72